MRLAIIEDERPAREKLLSCLRSAAPQAAIVAQLGSVAEAVQWFRENAPPDLLFCDILLSDGLSFEIFRSVPVRCPVVFTTAFDDYLLEAFQTNGIDYLLKPIRQAQVAAALGKYNALAAHFTADHAERLRGLANSEPRNRDRFLVRKGLGYLSIPVSDIAYFFSEQKLVFLVTHSGHKHLMEKSLTELEQELNSPRFFRANRAWLVAVEAVARCSTHGKGKLCLELRPPAVDPPVVSQERAEECRRWLGK